MNSGLRNSALRGLRNIGLALLVSTPAWAQTATGTLSGRVIDRQSQRPMVAVTVRVVGSQRGAQTDESGVYRIVNVPVGNVIIAANRIGYGPSSRQVAVDANRTTTVDFALSPAATALDQVVITATGQSERKRESGNSTATIDSSLVNMSTVSTFSDLLSSRAAGVVVQTNSGQVGSSSRVRIRGSHSLSLSNEPLLIIDGVRADNTPNSAAIGTGGQVPSRLNDLNPEEIESVEIIKGPAAAALYGTAASNGVIQVTMKKGRAGKTKWDGFSEYTNESDQNDYPLQYRSFGHTAANALVTNCSLQQRIKLATDASRCVAVDSTVTNSPLELTHAITDGAAKKAGLSLAGGSESSTYFLSGEYTHERGTIEINQYNKMNLRTNLRSQLAKNLDAQVSIGYVNSDLREPQNDNNIIGVVSGALLGKGVDCGPYGLNAAGNNAKYPLCGPDTTSRGYFNSQPPQAIWNINTRQQIKRLTGGVNLNYTPLSWLSINSTLGADVNNRTDNEVVPAGIVLVSQNTIDGSRSVFDGLIYNYTAGVNGTAKYEATPELKFTATLGTQYTDVFFHRTDAQGFKLLGGTGSLAGTSARFAVGEQTQDVLTRGYLGSGQVAWRDRMFLTLGVRTDKNSAFGANFERVYYPAVSGSYVISEESFFPKIDMLSSLRLRASRGSSGQNPGYLAAEQSFSPVAVVINQVDVPAFTLNGAGNPELKPEKSTETEFGFDLGLFRDRLSFEYTHYSIFTKDELVSVPIAPSVGLSATRFQNLGEVHNWGHEALMRATLLDNDNIGFDLTVNGSWNSNKLITLGLDAQGTPIPDIVLGSNSSQIFHPGLPLGSYYQHAITGVTDLNGDGLISCPGGRGSATCEVTVSDSNAYLGNFLPTNEISISPSLTLGKSIRVTATIDHRGGQKLFNLTHYFRGPSQVLAKEVELPDATNLDAQAATIAALFPAPYTTVAGFIENASFTKLREVAVTLSLPQRFAGQLRASSASLTLAGRNLKTWTNYTGLDPELNENAGAGFSTDDFLTLPPVRMLSARLSLSF
jgi:TonB-linked SusC/RagA family outer membrane protein